jgi:hypothetical protein
MIVLSIALATVTIVRSESMSELTRVSLFIRDDQKTALLSLAARRQIEEGVNVSMADVARAVIDAGLAVIDTNTGSENTPPQTGATQPVV